MIDFETSVRCNRCQTAVTRASILSNTNRFLYKYRHKHLIWWFLTITKSWVRLGWVGWGVAQGSTRPHTLHQFHCESKPMQERSIIRLDATGLRFHTHTHVQWHSGSYKRNQAIKGNRRLRIQQQQHQQSTFNINKFRIKFYPIELNRSWSLLFYIDRVTQLLISFDW